MLVLRFMSLWRDTSQKSQSVQLIKRKILAEFAFVCSGAMIKFKLILISSVCLIQLLYVITTACTHAELLHMQTVLKIVILVESPHVCFYYFYVFQCFVSLCGRCVSVWLGFLWLTQIELNLFFLFVDVSKLNTFVKSSSCTYDDDDMRNESTGRAFIYARLKCFSFFITEIGSRIGKHYELCVSTQYIDVNGKLC